MFGVKIIKFCNQYWLFIFIYISEKESENVFS